MNLHDIFSSHIVAMIVVPLLIVLSRIMDVSIGTLRIIFVSKGMKYVAPFLGFFEVLIWLVAISQIMQNLTNAVNYFAYALGFAIGNYVGIRIEERIALGNVVMRIITQKDAKSLITYLKNTDFKWTILDADGPEGPVNVLFTVLKRADLKDMVSIVKHYNPNAMYTVEDIRFISSGYLPTTLGSEKSARRFPILRKSK